MLAPRPAAWGASPMPAEPIRVLVVDDSVVARAVLRRLLERAGDFEVVAEANSADQALAKLRQHWADVVLLDINMPGTDGLTALPDLIAAANGARVVIVSGACADGAAATIRALALGAADALLKPDAARIGASFGDLLTARLRRLGRATPLAPNVRPLLPNDRPPQRVPARRGPVECIALGSSTGGIHALAGFFASFPKASTTPLLLTQHLPPPFMPFFAAQISDMVGRRAQVAQSGMRIAPGVVLVAPGEGHLTLVRSGSDVRVRIDSTPQPSGCQPSVDPMLASVAQIYGAAGVGVVLSGMGRDGVIGAEALVTAGGEVLAQDQASSVVWGMPGVVAAAGLASEVRPPAALAGHLARRMGFQGMGYQGDKGWI